MSSKAHNTRQRSRPTQSDGVITIEEIKRECGVSDEQLDQGIPRDALFDIARLIPNWYDYAGTPGMRLSEGDKLTISNNGWLTTNSAKAQKALEIWYEENPFGATFRCIVSMCLKRGDGATGVNIVKEVLLGTLNKQEDIDHPTSSLTDSKQYYMTSTPAPIQAQSLFKHIDSEEKLAHTVTKEFEEARLGLKSRELKKEFGVLYSSLRRALLDKKIEASDLISHLRDMEVFGPETEPIYTHQDVTLGTAISAMKIEPNLNDVFHLMAPYCSWFNHLLIESIIEVYLSGDKDRYCIHQRFVNFKRKFIEYCEYRCVQLDQENYGPDEVDGTTSAVFKIDQHWENIRLEQLRDITETLATALNISSHNLLLRTVNNGCLELNVAMPTHLAEELFPIQGHLLPALKNCKTLKYEQFPWTCDISNALEGIKKSKERYVVLMVQSRLRSLGDDIDSAHASELQEALDQMFLAQVRSVRHLSVFQLLRQSFAQLGSIRHFSVSLLRVLQHSYAQLGSLWHLSIFQLLQNSFARFHHRLQQYLRLILSWWQNSDCQQQHQRQNTWQLHEKEFRSKASPGAITGFLLADIGEQILPEFFTPPNEPKLIRYSGPLIQWSCYLIPALIPLGIGHRIDLGIAAATVALAIQYSRWRKYPRNLAVKRSVVCEVSASLGMLTASLIAINHAVSAETGSVFLFLGLLLGPGVGYLYN